MYIGFMDFEKPYEWDTKILRMHDLGGKPFNNIKRIYVNRL